MATLKTYMKNLIKFHNSIEDLREKHALAAAISVTSLMKRRIQTERLAPDGGTFGQYSPEYFARKKSKIGGDNRINWTDTGETIKSLSPRISKNTASAIEIVIEPDQERLRTRIGHLVDLQKRKSRNPDIIGFSEDEEELAVETFVDEFTKDIKRLKYKLPRNAAQGMIEHVIEIFKDRIVNKPEFNWVERYGGLTRVISIKDGKKVLEVPVTAKLSSEQCYENLRYKVLIPDENFKSIFYFEEVAGANLLEKKSGGTRKYGASVRIVVWLNLARLGEAGNSIKNKIAPIIISVFSNQSWGNYSDYILNIKTKDVEVQTLDETRTVMQQYSYGSNEALYFYPYETLTFIVPVTWMVTVGREICLDLVATQDKIDCIDYTAV